MTGFCANCGAKLAAPFCAMCGTKATDGSGPSNPVASSTATSAPSNVFSVGSQGGTLSQLATFPARIRAGVAGAVVLLIAIFNLLAQAYVGTAFREQQENVAASEGQSSESTGSPFDSVQWQNFEHQITALHLLLFMNSLLMIGISIGLFTWKGRKLALIALATTVIVQGLASVIADATRIEAVPRIAPLLGWYIIVVLPLSFRYFFPQKSSTSRVPGSDA